MASSPNATLYVHLFRKDGVTHAAVNDRRHASRRRQPPFHTICGKPIDTTYQRLSCDPFRGKVTPITCEADASFVNAWVDLFDEELENRYEQQ